MKYILTLIVSVGIVSTAYAGGFMMLHIGSSDGNGSGAAITGKILLVDGTSFILQTDAASKICRAGGC